MTFASAIAGTVRGLLIAAATGVAAFGLLVVFHPFGEPAPQPVLAVAPTTSAGTEALRTRIEAARASLRDTEAALAAIPTPQPAQPIVVISSPPADASDLRGRYDTQLAAATERRDLALRHAAGIREALDKGADLASLAGIRDSVVAGQLLARQSALEADIAEQSGRLKANHPAMLALAAQKSALAQQIRAEAAGIATALEAEARLDDAQVALLQQSLASAPPASQSPPATAAAEPATADTAAPLRERAAAQRAELDGLMQAYLNLDPAAAPVTLAAPAAPRADPLSPLNLFVVIVAALAALAFQVALAVGRRRHALDADVARWHRDAEADAPPMVAGVDLKAAS